MAEIIWSPYQVEHIEDRHSVTCEDFVQAWHDEFRQDLATGTHKKHGPYTVSIGSTENGIAVKMFWRWQGESVWPITAVFPSPPSPKPKRRKRREKK